MPTTDSPASDSTAAPPEALPQAFHVMTKPRGAICNLDCKYCYYLQKEELYPGSKFRMSDEVLEQYTKRYIETQQVPEVTFAWQGGEPTLMGLDYFKKAVAFQQKYKKPGTRIMNALQTNGTLLDDEWCAFFHEHDFLIGLSIDGPREMHDAYRVDKGGKPSWKKVMQGLELLRKHKVEFNTLTTLHKANVEKPLEVYHFLRDEVKSSFMQFIPIVERENETGYQEGAKLTHRSTRAAQYGRFLTRVFDEWARKDVGTTYVQIFDVALAAWSGHSPGLCIFEETCGNALAMEHNGDLYACDHYVEPNWLLGNIMDDDMANMVASPKQRDFGTHKRDALPKYCRDCDVRFVCNGGCPKNRTHRTPDGEAGLNHLCEGYKIFFHHVDGPMRFMARELSARRAPANIMAHLKEQDEAAAAMPPGRNTPCPCGSGKKYKQCCGKK